MRISWLTALFVIVTSLRATGLHVHTPERFVTAMLSPMISEQAGQAPPPVRQNKSRTMNVQPGKRFDAGKERLTNTQSAVVMAHLDLEQDFMQEFKKNEVSPKAAMIDPAAPQREPDFLGQVRFELSPGRIIAFMMYGFLVITGVYVILLGFRLFRVLMIVMSFQVSYYAILFAMVCAGVYQPNDVSHQLLLFFGCLLVGFGTTVLSSTYDKANYAVFGCGMATVISLFIAQFFIDFAQRGEVLLFISVYLLGCITLTLASYFLLNKILIPAASLIGAAMIAFNVGAICGNATSFDSRPAPPTGAWRDLTRYAVLCVLLAAVGSVSQFQLRRGILSKFSERTVEEELKESSCSN